MNAYHKFSVAPMLDWTDRHCRYFYRLMTSEALLYSEMITTGAILYGDRARHLAFNSAEAPLALQLGGSDPKDLRLCAKMGEDYGYTEINLNCGCPSDRVQKGKMGACLMAEPELVAQCYAEMQAAVSIPVTLKTRIGIDHYDDFEFLEEFVAKTHQSGCQTYIIHARKAWLSGLSPKENREIPPLDYERVYALKARYPQLTIVLNGGIETPEKGVDALTKLDGVMLGRAIYHDPYQLICVDPLFFNKQTVPKSRETIIALMAPYIADYIASGGQLKHIARHMLGLYHGRPKSRLWRRYLSEHMHLPGADYGVINAALKIMNHS